MSAQAYRPGWTEADARDESRQGPLYLLGAFYVAMAAIALYGQSDGLMVWLGVVRPVALAGAFAVELLAAVLFAFADWRRTRHAERASAARLLSVAVALGVAAMNFYGHEGNTGRCALFVGASLAGYAVWVLHTNARRRDALRAVGKLPATPPAYGLWEWFRHPLTTWRARTLAGANPALGLNGSLEAARAQAAAERRHVALSAALRRKLAAALDPISADLAIRSYDLDRVAADLAARMDYGRLIDLLAADLHPDRLTARTVRSGHRWRHRANAERETTADGKPEASADTVRARRRTSRRTARNDTATAVARIRVRYPDMSTADIASRLGVTDRTVRRHLASQRDDAAEPTAAAA